MKKINRIIALLLALMLIFTFSVVTVSADEAEEAENAETTESTETTGEDTEESTVNKELQPDMFVSSSTFTVPDSYTKVSENANLALFLDYGTGEYALYNKILCRNHYRFYPYQTAAFQ